MPPIASSPFDQLAAELEGDVHDDRMHRRLVAQDASPYRQMPRALAEPRHEADCERLVAFARERDLALIPRGGGTSLAGQCVGSGVVVDTSRHMNRTLAIDAAARSARVEPGVTAAQLNAAAREHGLQLGPDPSTANRATLGGMLGNNAWGPHAPVDGTTRDQAIALRAVLADGVAHVIGADGPDDASALPRREALKRLIDEHADALREHVPPPDSGLCSNTGYPLHHLLVGAPWNTDGPAFNEAVLFAGAEGTLGLVTEITLRLRPLRRERVLLCPHFAAGRRAVLFEEWLAGKGDALAEALPRSAPATGPVAVHVHCHGKAGGITEAVLRALALLPGAEPQPMAAGCCGMAGAFGYRRETAAVSRQVAELALAPSVRALPPDTTLVAHGASCRQQIARVTERRALHPAELVQADSAAPYVGKLYRTRAQLVSRLNDIDASAVAGVAHRSVRPVSPDRKLVVTGAIVGGLFFGVLLAFLSDFVCHMRAALRR